MTSCARAWLQNRKRIEDAEEALARRRKIISELALRTKAVALQVGPSMWGPAARSPSGGGGGSGPAPVAVVNKDTRQLRGLASACCQ